MNKIERFLSERRRILRQQEMDDQVVNTKPTKDYEIPIKEEIHYSIVYPTIAANNFDLEPTLIGMVQQNQFYGLPYENPNLYLSIIYENCDIINSNGIDQNSIFLRLFPLSLGDRAQAWLQSLPSNSITS